MEKTRAVEKDPQVKKGDLIVITGAGGFIAGNLDFAVMEPASRDPSVQVLVVPMPLKWVDVGSWNAFAGICPKDVDGNAIGAQRHLLLRSKNTLLASSDPQHLITTLGCENLIIIHTPDATLVCRADQAESIKEMHRLVGEQFGEESV